MIIVLSSGRAGAAKTLSWCSPDFIAVKKKEEKLYTSAYPGQKLLVMPNTMNTIGKVRQYLIDWSGKNHVQVDDDLSYRSLDGSSPHEHLSYILDNAAHYSLTSIGRQYFGGMRAKQKYDWEDLPCFEIFGVNYEDMRGGKFNQFCLAEDKAMNIHALSCRGTMVTHRGLITNVQTPSGGCAAYRTEQAIIESHRRINEKWPQYTKIVNRAKDNIRGVGTVEEWLSVSWSKISKERRVRNAK